MKYLTMYVKIGRLKWQLLVEDSNFASTAKKEKQFKERGEEYALSVHS